MTVILPLLQRRLEMRRNWSGHKAIRAYVGVICDQLVMLKKVGVIVRIAVKAPLLNA